MRGGAERERPVRLHFVDIHPPVNFNACAVRLADQECERIPSGVLSERPGEVLCPRFIRGAVVGVPAGTDLEKNRVEVVRLKAADDFAERCLLLGPVGAPRPVETGSGGEPHRAYLPLGGGRRLCDGFRTDEQERDEKERPDRQ